jgi:hypothetical protein
MAAAMALATISVSAIDDEETLTFTAQCQMTLSMAERLTGFSSCPQTEERQTRTQHNKRRISFIRLRGLLKWNPPAGRPAAHCTRLSVDKVRCPHVCTGRSASVDRHPRVWTASSRVWTRDHVIRHAAD